MQRRGARRRGDPRRLQLGRDAGCGRLRRPPQSGRPKQEPAVECPVARHGERGELRRHRGAGGTGEIRAAPAPGCRATGRHRPRDRARLRRPRPGLRQGRGRGRARARRRRRDPAHRAPRGGRSDPPQHQDPAKEGRDLHGQRRPRRGCRRRILESDFLDAGHRGGGSPRAAGQARREALHRPLGLRERTGRGFTGKSPTPSYDGPRVLSLRYVKPPERADGRRFAGGSSWRDHHVRAGGPAPLSRGLRGPASAAARTAAGAPAAHRHRHSRRRAASAPGERSLPAHRDRAARHRRVHALDGGGGEAQKLFGLDRAKLLEVGPVTLSPPYQPDGGASEQRARAYIQQALEGETPAFEWTHLDGPGREIICEVRLARLPSGKRRLVRGSIADISERKRAERMASAEHRVFEQVTRNSPLPEVLASITRLVESAAPGTAASVAMLTEDGHAFACSVAPQLPDALRTSLERPRIGTRCGSCAAAVYLGRQVLVADLGKDPFWLEHRELALGAGLRAAWSTPIQAAGGKLLGSLGVYRCEPGLPTAGESQIMARAAQLARIAIERRLAEEALRGSEAKFRGLFESIAEGVYQSRRDGRMMSVNPAFVDMLGYRTAEELYALPSVEALYWDPADRAEFVRRVESEGEIRAAEFLMRRRDGQQLVILENARLMRDGAGRILGYEGSITNITERKRAEQAIFAEKERAQVTLQSIGDAVISTDAEGRIEYINPVAERLTAWSLAEARGQPIGTVLRLVNELTREPVESSLTGALGRGGVGGPTDHSVLITRTGNEVAIQEPAAPICDRAGRVMGAVMVFHDVTQERRLKRALAWQAGHDAL